MRKSKMSQQRICKPCEEDYRRIFGDGTYGGMKRGSYEEWAAVVKTRSTKSGRQYELVDGVLTPGMMDLARDVLLGRVCQHCRTPFEVEVMPEPGMKLSAEWKDDCQGKKDYDGPIIEISTRYWPRGGGFHGYDSSKPELGMQGNETRPEIKPSSTCSLIIRFLDAEGCEDTLDLARAEFEGETFEEITPQVEKFAQEQMDRVVAVLREVFSTK